MNCSCHSENFEILSLVLASFVASNFKTTWASLACDCGCCQLPSPSGVLQVSRAHGSSNLVLYYAKGNTVTGMALPVVVVAIPLAHKSTQVPTPQLIYFCPGKSSDSSLTRSSFVAFSPVTACLPGERNRRKHLPKIFNRHLCTTIPVAIRCRLASPCLLFLLCAFVYVRIYVYVDFFVLLLNSQVAFEVEFSTAPLLALTVCFLCYFPAKKKKVSLSISRIMHNNNTKKSKKNTQLWSWTWIPNPRRVGGFAAVTVTTTTTAATICGKWLP